MQDVPALDRVRLPGTLLLAMAVSAPLAAETPTKVSDDLTIDFLAGAQASQTLTRSELKALGTEKAEVPVGYTEGVLTADVLPLLTLLETLDVEGDYAVVTYSYDGYISYFPRSFIEKFDPYIVLRFDKLPEGRLQPAGAPDLGPYYITFEAEIPRGDPEVPDPDNKRPYGVDRILIGPEKEIIAPLYAGNLADVSGPAILGSKLTLNNCLSCHAWPGDTTFTATFSNRNMIILKAHAMHNTTYFNDMIKDPATLMPDAKMAGHPHYSDEDIAAIRAYLEKSFN